MYSNEERYTVVPTAERTANFILTMLTRRLPVPFSHFNDQEAWGCERSFRRLRTRVNEMWELKTGQPLFEIVEADGSPARRYDLAFLRRVWK